MDQSKQPQITALNLTQLLGPGGEPAMHIDLTIALRNRVQVEAPLLANRVCRRTNVCLALQGTDRESSIRQVNYASDERIRSIW